MYVLAGSRNGRVDARPDSQLAAMAPARDKGPIARAGLSNVSLEQLKHASGRRHSGSSGHPEPDNLRAARPHGWHGPRHSDSVRIGDRAERVEVGELLPLADDWARPR